MIDCNAEYMILSKEERQSHLVLSEDCVLRGADSIQCRGLLAYYLDTSLPKVKNVVLAHACHNADCNNPKHLYWATYRENVQDKFTSPDSERIRKGMSDRAKGSLNVNYGKKPWLVQNSHSPSWMLAQYLYDEYFIKGWDYSKYGKGLTYFIQKYGIASGSGKAMLKMFRSGWVPKDDPQWISWRDTA